MMMIHRSTGQGGIGMIYALEANNIEHKINKLPHFEDRSDPYSGCSPVKCQILGNISSLRCPTFSWL